MSKIFKRLWYRPYYAVACLIALSVWIAKRAKPSPELGPFGRTRWRCVCGMWRYSMAHADYRIGLAVSPGQALKDRLGRTMYGEARREAMAERDVFSWFLGSKTDSDEEAARDA